MLNEYVNYNRCDKFLSDRKMYVIWLFFQVVKYSLIIPLIIPYSSLIAKEYYFRYIFKEKPRFYNLNWKSTDLPLAKLYYYEGEEELASYIGKFAAEFQEEITKKTTTTIKGKVPIFLYSTRPIFKQTRIIPFAIPEGLLGFAMIEPARRTAFVHEGSLRATKHLTRHELMHAFLQEVYEIVEGKQKYIKIRTPLWFEEGLAEAFSKKWDSWDDLIMRDLALNRAFDLEDFNYQKSHSFVRYLIDKYGEEKMFEFLKKEKDFYYKFKDVYGKELKDLIADWRREMEKKYFTLAANDSMDEISKLIDTGYSPVFIDSMTIYYIHTAHGVNRIVKRTYNPVKKNWSERKILYKDMKIGMELIKAINCKNDTFVFIARVEGRDYLFLHRKNTLHKIKPDNVLVIYDVDLYKDKITFTGQTIDGRRDLYLYHITEKRLHRLTTDFYCDITPSFKSESEILFASDRYGNYDIFLINHITGEIERITEFESEEFKPCFFDGDIFFISDANGTFNLCRMKNNNEIIRTNVIHGILDYSIYTSSHVALVYYKNAEQYVYTSTLHDLKLDKKEVLSGVENEIVHYEKIKLDPRPYSFYPVGLFSGMLIYNEFDNSVSGSVLLNVTDFLGECDFFLITALSREQLFWFTFENLRYPWGYRVNVFNLRYGVYSETGDYSFATKGITLSFEKPLSDFHAIGTWYTVEMAKKELGGFGFFIPFFEGIGPPTGHGQLNSLGVFMRKDTTTWNFYGPVSGTVMRLSAEISRSETGSLSGALWGTWIYHFPIGRSCYATRIISAYSFGERARLYRLGGFTLMSYDLFQAFESRAIIALSNEFRFPLIQEIGVRLFNLFIGFRDIETALFIDLVGADKNFGAVGLSIRVPFGLLLKFNYVKITDFKNLWDDLNQPGTWRFSLGYNF